MNPHALATRDDGLAAFLEVRPRLFGIAHRMLRSAAEAEDLVQDVWLRWQAADRTVVRNARAFLVTTATRLAINVMQSARARHEASHEPFGPEPLDTSDQPGVQTERREALAWGVRLLYHRLSPRERAAYILREAFGYAYRDIGRVLRLAEANARQVVVRARQHIASGSTETAPSAGEDRLLAAFIAAARDGDLARLESLLAADVLATVDRSVGTAEAA